VKDGMNPTTLRQSLGKWFRANQRDLPWRRTKDPYCIWVSEVMLQQTRVAAVIPYYLKFLDRFPDVFRLAGADLQDVLKIWEGMGYYARARNLHKTANVVVDRHDGIVPDDPAVFRALPGVGDYIAAAVASIAFGRPLAVTDGNVKRVIARLYKMDAPINKPASYKIYHGMAVALLDHDDPGMFNQALMELGALVCRPKLPDCPVCPLSGQCLACQGQTVAAFPVREKKSPVPERRQAVGVVFRKGRVLILRRPEDGLLGGLWEFPGGDIMDNESPEAACARIMGEQTGLEVTVGALLTRIRHTYSHFRLEADVFICEEVLGNGPMVAENVIGYDDSEANGTSERTNGRAAWASPDELDRHPFHRAAAGIKSLILDSNRYEPM
jgi:A/G-specific adenine glycosylase